MATSMSRVIFTKKIPSLARFLAVKYLQGLSLLPDSYIGAHSYRTHGAP
jgi:hypothetical protein